MVKGLKELLCCQLFAQSVRSSAVFQQEGLTEKEVVVAGRYNYHRP